MLLIHKTRLLGVVACLIVNLSGVRIAELASAAPTEAAVSASTCGGSVQPLLDAASPDSTVTLPPCIARETLTISKPLTLRGQPGSEIRGSDIWADWQQRGGRWVSAQTV